MANQFVSLPPPATSGPGAAVDVSTFGANKTIVVSGSWTLPPTVNVEFNNAANAADGTWQSIKTFQGGGKITVDLACRWMRVSISNYRGGGQPVTGVGGTDDGTEFVNLPAPSGVGAGAAVDVSTLGLFKTVQVGDEFRGAVSIELSNDGGATWGTQFSFNTPGAQSAVFSADFMRVTRSGVPLVNPGLPEVNVGACDIGGGGGGGGGDRQTFQYEVTGLEPDLSELVIPLPAARASADYVVTPTQEDAEYDLAMRVPDASKTTTQFVLSLSADATTGDIFSFVVEDLS